MQWSDLASQFLLELAFGVLFALAFVPRAPVGVLFYRIMGTAAFLATLGAVLGQVAVGGRPWAHPAVLAPALALALWPVYSGPVRGPRWAAALGLALAGTAAGVVALVSQTVAVGAGGAALASLSALATGAVAGSVGLAMVLGHWYLTVPNLDVRHLVRLNRVTVGSMLASLALVGLTSWHVAGPGADGRGVLAPTGLFYLGTRLAVGLLVPLLFAWMAAGSLRYRNTRSATGILYASTVLVLIGTAASLALQDSYGVPL